MEEGPLNVSGHSTVIFGLLEVGGFPPELSLISSLELMGNLGSSQAPGSAQRPFLYLAFF